MNFFNTPAGQSLLQVLILPLVLSICLTAGATLWSHFRSRLPKNIADYLQQLATDAVAKAEQLATRGTDAISPDARKQQAVLDIKEILKAHGLTNVVPGALIDMAVEAAVFHLKTTGMVSTGNAPIPLEIQTQLASGFQQTTNSDATTYRVTPSVTVPATVGGIAAGTQVS